MTTNISLNNVPAEKTEEIIAEVRKVHAEDEKSTIRNMHPDIKALQAENFWVVDTVDSLETLKVWDEPTTANKIIIKEIPNVYFYFKNELSWKTALISAFKNMKECNFTGENHVEVTPTTEIIKSFIRGSLITGDHVTINKSSIINSILTNKDRGEFIIVRSNLVQCTTGEEATLTIFNSNLANIIFVTKNKVNDSELSNLKLNDSDIFDSKIQTLEIDGVKWAGRIKSSKVFNSTLIMGRSHLTETTVTSSKIALADSHIKNSSLIDIKTISELGLKDKALKLNGKVLVVNPGLKAEPLIFHKEDQHRKVIVNKKSYTLNDGLKQVQNMENRLLSIQYEPAFVMGENFFNLLDIIGNN